MILNGWKEIANHLGRGVRTVQRWEKLGLPVRRPNSRLRSAVICTSEELDVWVSKCQTGRPPEQIAMHSDAGYQQKILQLATNAAILKNNASRLVEQVIAIQARAEARKKLRAQARTAS
jgi:hypothetical protein